MTLGVEESYILDEEISAYYSWIDSLPPEEAEEILNPIVCYSITPYYDAGVTPRQRDYINSIEHELHIMFWGRTRREASDFIEKHSWKLSNTNRRNNPFR
jgi:hypothetical protein